MLRLVLAALIVVLMLVGRPEPEPDERVLCDGGEGQTKDE